MGRHILIVCSSPRTFGIKYGVLVMCFINIGEVLSSILVLLVAHEPFSLFSAGIVGACIALAINVFAFREKLDIKTLLDKQMVIFDNFGIK